ncbi:hypothetical protein IWQ57_005974, partial [Coemansia nantahalensis]
REHAAAGRVPRGNGPRAGAEPRAAQDDVPGGVYLRGRAVPVHREPHGADGVDAVPQRRAHGGGGAAAERRRHPGAARRQEPRVLRQPRGGRHAPAGGRAHVPARRRGGPDAAAVAVAGQAGAPAGGLGRPRAERRGLRRDRGHEDVHAADGVRGRHRAVCQAAGHQPGRGRGHRRADPGRSVAGQARAAVRGPAARLWPAAGIRHQDAPAAAPQPVAGDKCAGRVRHPAAAGAAAAGAERAAAAPGSAVPGGRRGPGGAAQPPAAAPLVGAAGRGGRRRAGGRRRVPGARAPGRSQGVHAGAGARACGHADGHDGAADERAPRLPRRAGGARARCVCVAAAAVRRHGGDLLAVLQRGGGVLCAAREAPHAAGADRRGNGVARGRGDQEQGDAGAARCHPPGARGQRRDGRKVRGGAQARGRADGPHVGQGGAQGARGAAAVPGAVARGAPAPDGAHA